jgi:hypothetical protein
MNNQRPPDWTPLTEHQLATYASNGYLHLRGMFSPAEVELGRRILQEAVESPAPSIAAHNSYLDPPHSTRIRNAIAHQPALAYFLDHPGLVGPLVSLLGASVQILGTEIFLRRLDSSPMVPWHTDGGQALQQIRVDPAGRSLQIKAQIFLTKVSGEGCANFLLIPGSQRRVPTPTGPRCYIDELNTVQHKDFLPEGGLRVEAEPGDVLLFPYSLWHAVDRNIVRPRETFILRFGQMFERPQDYFQQPDDLLARFSPRLRRMFGGFGPDVHPLDYYKSDDQDEVMATGGDYLSLLPVDLIERHGAAAYSSAGSVQRFPVSSDTRI